MDGPSRSLARWAARRGAISVARLVRSFSFFLSLFGLPVCSAAFGACSRPKCVTTVVAAAVSWSWSALVGAGPDRGGAVLPMRLPVLLRVAREPCGCPGPWPDACRRSSLSLAAGDEGCPCAVSRSPHDESLLLPLLVVVVVVVVIVTLGVSVRPACDGRDDPVLRCGPSRRRPRTVIAGTSRSRRPVGMIRARRPLLTAHRSHPDTDRSRNNRPHDRLSAPLEEHVVAFTRSHIHDAIRLSERRRRPEPAPARRRR